MLILIKRESRHTFYNTTKNISTNTNMTRAEIVSIKQIFTCPVRGTEAIGFNCCCPVGRTAYLRSIVAVLLAGQLPLG